MKSLKVLVWFVTLFIVLYTLLTQLELAFPLVFLSFLIAQGLLMYMVWRILRNPYNSEKVFDDWYGDKQPDR